MKIYKLKLDPTKPTRKMLSVPVNTSKYGVAVEYENAPSTLSCYLVDGNDTTTPTKQLDDGSYLFELSSNAAENDREVVISASAEPVVVLEASEREIMQQVFASFTAPFPAGNFKAGDLDLWGVKAGLFDWDGFMVATNTVTFVMNASDQTNFSQVIVTKDGTITFYHADGSVFGPDEVVTFNKALSAKTAKGAYFARRDFTYHYAPTTYGKAMSTSHSVVLNEERAPVADGEIQDDIIIDGVKYEPTTIVVDGTSYNVLAAVS